VSSAQAASRSSPTTRVRPCCRPVPAQAAQAASPALADALLPSLQPPGNRITPSWVAFTEDERLVGDAAKNQAPQNARNTVFDAKRLVGRKFDEQDVQKDLKHWPFKVTSKAGKPQIQVHHKGDIKNYVRPSPFWLCSIAKETNTDSACAPLSSRPRRFRL
jgi:hypothetical protein